jgi:hypothetical protein
MILFLGSTLLSVQAQKSQTLFGLQFRPIFNSSIFGDNLLEMENEDLIATSELRFSRSLGMIIRHNFTDRWSLETGINHLRRNYWIDADSKVSEDAEKFDIGSVTYELPIEALYYVRLSDQVYMNALAGGSFNIFPTQLATTSENLAFSAKAARVGWVSISLLANIGFEYRTDDAGYFYIGASLHRPLRDIYQMQVDYRPNTAIRNSAYGFQRGNFLSFDIKYFFKADEPKKK